MSLTRFILIFPLVGCDPAPGDDTGDTEDTSDTSSDTSDTSDTATTGIEDGFVYVLGEDLQVDLLTDHATLWAAPADAEGNADTSAAVRLHPGEIRGFASYSDGLNAPFLSADQDWVAFADAETQAWHLVRADASAAPVAVPHAGSERSFAPTGSRFLGADSGGATLYDPVTGATLATATWSGDVTDVTWAPDGSAAVVRVHPDTDEFDLWVLRGDGTVTNLGASVTGNQWAGYLSGDGSRVLWVHDERLHLADSNGANASDAAACTYIGPEHVTADKAFVCDAGGCSLIAFDGAVTTLSQTVGSGSFRWSADGTRAYAFRSALLGIDGATGAVTTYADFGEVEEVSPDGAWVVAGDGDGWSAVPADGGAALPLGATKALLQGVLWADGFVIWVAQDYDRTSEAGGVAIPQSLLRDEDGWTLEEAGQVAAVLQAREDDGYVLQKVGRDVRNGRLEVVYLFFFDADLDSHATNGDGVVDKPPTVVVMNRKGYSMAFTDEYLGARKIADMLKAPHLFDD